MLYLLQAIRAPDINFIKVKDILKTCSSHITKLFTVYLQAFKLLSLTHVKQSLENIFLPHIGNCGSKLMNLYHGGKEDTVIHSFNVHLLNHWSHGHITLENMCLYNVLQEKLLDMKLDLAEVTSLTAFSTLDKVK